MIIGASGKLVLLVIQGNGTQCLKTIFNHNRIVISQFCQGLIELIRIFGLQFLNRVVDRFGVLCLGEIGGQHDSEAEFVCNRTASVEQALKQIII